MTRLCLLIPWLLSQCLRRLWLRLVLARVLVCYIDDIWTTAPGVVVICVSLSVALLHPVPSCPFCTAHGDMLDCCICLWWLCWSTRTSAAAHRTTVTVFEVFMGAFTTEHMCTLEPLRLLRHLPTDGAHLSGSYSCFCWRCCESRLYSCFRWRCCVCRLLSCFRWRCCVCRLLSCFRWNTL